MEVADAVKILESIYKFHVDIEFCYGADNVLYILQSRPVTTHVLLPPSMITDSKEQKRLYIDASTIVQGIDEPITVMGKLFSFDHLCSYRHAQFLGIDVLRQVFVVASNTVFGMNLLDQPVDKCFLFGADNGRLYGNLSAVFGAAGKASNLGGGTLRVKLE